MFRVVVISALAMFAGHVETETKLDLYRSDEKVGVGTYKETFDHKGHRTSELHIYTREDARVKVSLYNVKVIDEQAYPIRESEKIVFQDGKDRSVTYLTVRYDGSGSAIFTKQTDNTKYSEKILPPLPGYSRADASDLWFTKTNPLPNTTVASTVFDIEEPGWRRVETTYIGKRWITVGGRQIEANEVRDIRDGNVRRVYLDDRGQPVRMVNGPWRTEKHF